MKKTKFSEFTIDELIDFGKTMNVCDNGYREISLFSLSMMWDSFFKYAIDGNVYYNKNNALFLMHSFLKDNIEKITEGSVEKYNGIKIVSINNFPNDIALLIDPKDVRRIVILINILHGE